MSSSMPNMNETKKFRIILAEDEPALREVLMELLVDEGYECVPVKNGQEAADRMTEEKFDLLISDFRMPVMNGAELLIWCRENDIHLPVIFITANKDLFPDEQLALNDCCADLLQKPLDFNVLIAAIDDAKTRNHQRNCDVLLFKQ